MVSLETDLRLRQGLLIAHLRAGIQQQPPNRRKYNTDSEKQWQDRLRGEDGSRVSCQQLRIENRVSQLTATPSIAVGEMQYLCKDSIVSAVPFSPHSLIAVVSHLLVSCSSPSCLPAGPSPPRWSHLDAVAVLALPS